MVSGSKSAILPEPAADAPAADVVDEEDEADDEAAELDDDDDDGADDDREDAEDDEDRAEDDEEDDEDGDADDEAEDEGAVVGAVIAVVGAADVGTPFELGEHAAITRTRIAVATPYSKRCRCIFLLLQNTTVRIVAHDQVRLFEPEWTASFRL